MNKCSVLHLGRCNPKVVYSAGTVNIPSVDSAKDLGIIVSNSLNWHDQCNAVVNKANMKSSLIFKGFYNNAPSFLLNLYHTFVLPNLEYCSPVWSPPHLQDIDAIERVQSSFTKRLPGTAGLSYKDRLQKFDLEPLELRRLKADLIVLYKILNGLIDINFNSRFAFAPESRTRGHHLKLPTSSFRLDVGKFTYANRIVKVWNALPVRIVSSTTLSTFKKELNRVVPGESFSLWSYMIGNKLK